MTNVATRARGQPLIVLAVLFMAWIVGRALLWESPFALATVPEREDFSLLASAEGAENSAIAVATVKAYGRADPAHIAPPAALLPGQMGAASIAPPAWFSTPLAWPANAAGELVPNPDIAGGHQLLWMAAMAHLPVPRALSEQIVTAAAPDRARVQPLRQGRCPPRSVYDQRICPAGPALADAGGSLCPGRLCRR